MNIKPSNLLIYKIIKFLLVLNFAKKVNCKNKSWSYQKCKNILNNLDITCKNISKEKDGNYICKEWEINYLLDYFLIPEECTNKKYLLNFIVKNSNPPVNKKLYFYLGNNFEFQNKFINKNIDKNDKKKMCLKIFEDLEKISNINITDENNINIKEYITNYCNNLLNIENNPPFKNIEIMNNLKNKVVNKFIIKTINKNIENKDNNQVIKNIKNKIENDEYEEEKENEEEVKSYFNSMKKNEEDIDNFNGHSKNGKDCIEYGLKSIKEDIIVCTKYE